MNLYTFCLEISYPNVKAVRRIAVEVAANDEVEAVVHLATFTTAVEDFGYRFKMLASHEQPLNPGIRAVKDLASTEAIWEFVKLK